MDHTTEGDATYHLGGEQMTSYLAISDAVVS